MHILKLIIFYHGYIYRISVCFVFPCTVKVSIPNYTCTIRPSVHLEIDHFYHGYIYRISVCFVFASTVKVSIRNYACTKVLILKKIIFYNGYIYRISVCFVFPCTVKVSIRNHTCTIRPTVHHEIEYFLPWLYIQDFCMFCISKYCKGINTKLHLHYKTKCTS